MKGERIIEPLLYIDQPILQKPKAYMQVHYQDTKKSPKAIEETITNSDEMKDETPRSNHSDYSFKNLTIQEKINYLVKLPSEVPKIKCEVITDDKKYRGILIENREEEIVLRIFGRENTSVKKDEILNINLLGF